MTIECREAYLFGLIKKKPTIIPPGHEEILTEIDPSRRITLQVDTPDSVKIINSVFSRQSDKQRVKDEINHEKITMEVSLMEFILGKTKTYTWTSVSRL